MRNLIAVIRNEFPAYLDDIIDGLLLPPREFDVRCLRDAREKELQATLSSLQFSFRDVYK